APPPSPSSTRSTTADSSAAPSTSATRSASGPPTGPPASTSSARPAAAACSRACPSSSPAAPPASPSTASAAASSSSPRAPAPTSSPSHRPPSSPAASSTSPSPPSRRPSAPTPRSRRLCRTEPRRIRFDRLMSPGRYLEQDGAQATSPQHLLLTGATGFVGSHAAEAFVRHGFNVRALVRSRARARALEPLGIDLVDGSLEDAHALAAACDRVDTVVHIAALTHARSADQFSSANVDGTRRLLHAAVDAGVPRFVYLSSLAACGPSATGNGVSATDSPRPLTRYGRSKLEGERVC